MPSQIPEWYNLRREIRGRREYLNPQLRALYQRVESFFTAFDADPLTEEAVFVTTWDENDDYPGGLVTIKAITGRAFTIGLKADATNIETNAPFSLPNGYDVGTEIQKIVILPSAAYAFATFTSDHGATLDVVLEQWFNAWAEAALH